MRAENLDRISRIQRFFQCGVSTNQHGVREKFGVYQLALFDGRILKTLLQQVQAAELFGTEQVFEVNVENKRDFIALGKAVYGLTGTGID